MKDLHIVIVSWNVRDELERCLKSLPAACGDLSWECIVVDNNSSDDSAALIQETSTQEPRVDYIFNKVNLGFSRACNQGAVNHNARNVLLLNPDTECPADSLKQLVQKMDSRDDIGIMGPRIVYPDGSYQQCVWRFPSLASQSLIMLKLHHVFPKSKILTNYFAKDLEIDKAQEVDQVMGACFLIKAACWDQIKGLDQRYFIWFEEVDACKQAKADGWKVFYEPSITIIHHGGQSFAKAFTLRKQMYFNDSLKKYMLKWHGAFAWLIVFLLHPLSLFLAWLVGLSRYTGLLKDNKSAGFKFRQIKSILKLPCQKFLSDALYWFLLIAGLESASLLLNNNYVLQSLVAAALSLIMIVLAYKKPALALSAVATELLIGGFGYLFSFSTTQAGLGISLRLLIMAGFGVGWGVNALKHRIWKYWRLKELFILQAWGGVALLVFIGLIRGLQLNTPFLFQDANAWFFLLYFIPVLDISHRYANELKRHFKSALLASLIWLAFKVLVTFYLFSHAFWGIEYWYTWIRDTRIGEITPAGNGLYRVFFQSAIYQIFIPIYIFAWWAAQKKVQDDAIPAFALRANNQLPRLYTWFLISTLWMLSTAVILLSLSRSFWLGTAVGGVLILALAIFQFKKIPFQAVLKAILGSLGAVLIIAGIMFFPWPQQSQGSLVDLFGSRGSVSDAAASSRWNLLPAMVDKIKKEPILGHGFGSTITYQSQDPRVLKQNPDGWYTTYAFEWGWLSFYLKFGIFGIPIMLLLLISLSVRIWRAPILWWIRAGSISCLAVLATVHFFTPYLDHPLGFAWLLALEGMLVVASEQ